MKISLLKKISLTSVIVVRSFCVIVNLLRVNKLSFYLNEINLIP
ncbi:MAG: hypothetical protein K0S32_677 [Bacteroidetes bacterium]|nr:hypothetical protein [Bacteroidota bacterium]